MIYRRNWLWFFILVFLPLFLAGCSGIRWQMKETVFLVYEELYSTEGTVLPISGAQVLVLGEGFSGRNILIAPAGWFFNLLRELTLLIFPKMVTPRLEIL